MNCFDQHFVVLNHAKPGNRLLIMIDSFISARSAAQWSSAHTGSLVKLYDEMLAKNPKAYTAQRIVLNFVEGKKNTVCAY